MRSIRPTTMNYNYITSGGFRVERLRSVVGLRNKFCWPRFEFLISALMNIMYSGMSCLQIFTDVSKGHSNFLFSVRQSVRNTLCCNKVGLNVAAPTCDAITEIRSHSIEFLSVTVHYRIRQYSDSRYVGDRTYRLLMITSFSWRYWIKAQSTGW